MRAGWGLLSQHDPPDMHACRLHHACRPHHACYARPVTTAACPHFPLICWPSGAHQAYMRAHACTPLALQLYFNYHPDVMHRPDVVLAQYGFALAPNPPLLCAEDLCGFHPGSPFMATPLRDSVGECSCAPGPACMGV